MWTFQGAKNNFDDVVDGALAGRPQVILRGGSTAVVVLSVSEYQRLLKAEAAPDESFVDHLLAFPDALTDRGDASREMSPFEAPQRSSRSAG